MERNLSTSQQLDTQVVSNIYQIDGLSKHASAGSILRVNAYEEIGRDPHEGKVRSQLLDDGSSLVVADELTRAKLRDLEPGSIVAYLRTNQAIDPTVKNDKLIHAMALAETVGMIIEHTEQGTILVGAVKKPEVGSAVTQGRWGVYKSADGSMRSEKVDAIASFQRLFDMNDGIEATQMLSSVFSLSQSGADSSVLAAGCFSHEKPKAAIPQNFLLGQSIFAPPMIIDRDMPNLILRLRVSDDGGVIQPLTTVGKKNLMVTEESLLETAFNNKAIAIAASNPTGMGAGTTPERVMEALMETTIGLKEVIGNDGTVRQTQQILRGNLGVR